MSFIDLFRFKKKPFKEPRKPEKREEKKEREASKPVETAKEERISQPSVYSNVLRAPYLSEKSTLLAERSKFVFEVAPDAKKEQISRAVKAVYGVEPAEVSILKMRGRSVRYGKKSGTTKLRKKAIVTLPEGKKIDLYK